MDTKLDESKFFTAYPFITKEKIYQIRIHPLFFFYLGRSLLSVIALTLTWSYLNLVPQIEETA